MAEKFDLIVVGAGPGGYPAAIRGAQLGFKVACVERERAGGICLNWGCIPTKALLKSADAMRTVQHAADFGITVKGEIGFDWSKVIARSRGVAEKLAGGVDSLFRKYKVNHIKGTASLTGRGKVDVKTPTGVQKLEAPRIIIATGARAKFLPGIEADGDRVITYRDAMVLPEAPKSVVVIGAGAIGVEFADFWNAFGVDVTIIEFMPRLVPIEDEEVSKLLARSFQKKGIKVLTGTKTTGVKVSGKTVTTSYTTPDGKDGQLTTDRVLAGGGGAGQRGRHRPGRDGREAGPRIHPGGRPLPDHQPGDLGGGGLRGSAAAGARRHARGGTLRGMDGREASGAGQL